MSVGSSGPLIPCSSSPGRFVLQQHVSPLFLDHSRLHCQALTVSQEGFRHAGTWHRASQPPLSMSAALSGFLLEKAEPENLLTKKLNRNSKKTSVIPTDRDLWAVSPVPIVGVSVSTAATMIMHFNGVSTLIPGDHATVYQSHANSPDD